MTTKWDVELNFNALSPVCNSFITARKIFTMDKFGIFKQFAGGDINVNRQ
jgi:hypothetical protein